MRDITNNNHMHYSNDLSKSLSIAELRPKPNKFIDKPIYKTFSNKKYDDPLEEFLVQSQSKINQYCIKLYQDSQSRRNSTSNTEQNHREEFLANQSASTPIKQSKSHKIKKKRSEDEDKLACHADNILKMAIDSTILGSLNSFTDIYTDEYEDENSILLGKNKKVLNPKKALKFDINADELNAAINGI